MANGVCWSSCVTIGFLTFGVYAHRQSPILPVADLASRQSCQSPILPVTDLASHRSCQSHASRKYRNACISSRSTIQYPCQASPTNAAPCAPGSHSLFNNPRLTRDKAHLREDRSRHRLRSRIVSRDREGRGWRWTWRTLRWQWWDGPWLLGGVSVERGERRRGR